MTIELDSALSIITSIITIVGTLIGLYLFGYRRGVKSVQNEIKSSYKQRSYELVYAPLRNVLLDTHISTASLVRYGWFNQRWERAKIDFKKLRIIRAIKKLFDKGRDKRIAGVDYGDFPLEKIKKIITENIQWADGKLISHLQFAERSRIEKDMEESYINKPSDGILTHYEFELVNHIYDTYHRLNNKLFPEK